MKRIIARILIAAMLLTALALPLTSCSEEDKLLRMDESERAVAFYGLIDAATQEASSFSVEQKLSFKLDIGDMAYEQVNEGTITYIMEGDDLTYLEQSTTTVWVGGEKTVTYVDEGYADGMMFTYYKEGKVENKLKSPITVEEYEAFREHQVEDVPDVQVGEGFCTVMTCQQAEDGTWTATYEGFSEEGMKPFLHLLKGVETAVNAEHTLKDVRLTCTADSKLIPQAFVMEFVFEEKEGAETRVPIIKTESYYKGINNTVLTEPYDLSDFTEQTDLRMIENFTSALQDRENALSGSFTVTTEASADYAGQSNEQVTNQNITYKNNNGYELTLEYKQEEYRVKVSYKNGTMTTSIRDESGKTVHSESAEMTDFEAQATCRQFMNSESISALDIIGGEVRDEAKGIYRFTLGDSVKNSLNEQYWDTYGTDIDKFSGYIDATVVDGKLMSYSYHVYNTLKIEGETLTITVDMTVRFSDLVEDGESV